MIRSRAVLVFSVLIASVFFIGASPDTPKASPDFAMNATIIEACSCQMFCPCYFSSEPTGHESHGGHYCRFNNVFRVNKGHYGATNLEGAKFWVSGDLGMDFSKGMDWAVLTFDPAVTKEQREGVIAALTKLYPVKWNSFKIADDAPIDWSASKESARATLAGGKLGDVTLAKNPGMTDDPVVISNLRYWGASHNDGFVLMPNKVETYKGGDKPFEYHGTNGFMITVDVSSGS